MAEKVKREKDKAESIRVFVRARPLSQQEKDARNTMCIDISGAKDISIRAQYGKKYAFDKVFGSSVGQLDVYKTVVKPLIAEVLTGYNCTVFAYGQTGTGKTYTMAGGCATTSNVAWQNDPEAGIIPRALSHLFDELQLIQQQYTVRVSYMELYNEELYDLLSDTVENKGIKIYEDQQQKGSVVISGITKETVCNKQEVYQILQKGQDRRKTASTILNTQSSRSHTVFSIMVHTCETTLDGEELVKTGKLNLVDLAGSENISRSGAVDLRAREAGNINQSLLTLGRVIKALTERSGHIPYRESKLTRILQDSLGGRTKTSIIATISPALSCIDETLSTLEYAFRARNIQNKPEINQRLSQKVWRTQYEKEINRLQKDLDAARTGTGIYLDRDNYERMIAEGDQHKEELAAKFALVRQLEEKLTTMREENELINAEWNQLRDSFETMRRELQKTISEKSEQEFLATYLEEKATTMQTQAHILLDRSNTNVLKFHKKIDKLRSISNQNNDMVKHVVAKVVQKGHNINWELKEFMVKLRCTNESVANTICDIQEKQTANYKLAELSSTSLVNEAQNLVGVMCCDLEQAYAEDEKRNEAFFSNISAQLQDIQNMTTWVDVQLELSKLKEDVLSDANEVSEGLDEQQKLNTETQKELYIIRQQMHELRQENTTVINGLVEKIQQLHQTNEKVMSSVTGRLGVIEERLSSRQTGISECSSVVNNTKSLAQDKIPAISARFQVGIELSAELLSQTLDTVEKKKSQRLAVNQVVKQTQICKRNIMEQAKKDHSEPENLLESHFLNLKKIVDSQLENVSTTLSECSTSNNEMLNQLKELNEAAAQHESGLTGSVNECQESLINVVTKDLNPSKPVGDTPVRATVDPTTLAQLTPKERVISRYREQSQALNTTLFKEESTEPSLP